MNYRDLLRTTITSLKGNLLRSTLSSLGVFMGVFAISGTLQVGDIGKSYLSKQVEDLEAPQIFIYPPYDGINDEFTLYQPEDIDFLKAKLSGWQYITSIEEGNYSTMYFDKEKLEISSQAVDQDYLKVTGRKIIAGSFFSEADFRNSRPVILIDPILAQKAFRGKNPLHKTIYFEGKSYYVKGVIQLKQVSTWDSNQGMIILPISTYFALRSQEGTSRIVIRPKAGENLETVTLKAEELIRSRYPNTEVFAFFNLENIQFFQKIIRIVSLILFVIGSIALFVGGVGIANITIASVAERTSEIGLRRAIGATQQEIMLQFLLESTLVSMIGGIMAIATVQGITFVVITIFNLPYQFNYQTPLISLGSATCVGIIASFIPARHASKLDPVNALNSQ